MQGKRQSWKLAPDMAESGAMRHPKSLLVPATADDAPAIAALHATSWRLAYRGMLPDRYLDEEVFEDRSQFWAERFRAPAPERRLILKAMSLRAPSQYSRATWPDRPLSAPSTLDGFVCVLLDADPRWGARLDNLHVRQQLQGAGIGHALFNTARAWVAHVEPEQSMHLWVVEANQNARRFYDRQGGTVVQQTVRHVARGLSVPELRYHWPPLTAASADTDRP